jgi:hypothetical protein
VTKARSLGSSITILSFYMLDADLAIGIVIFTLFGHWILSEVIEAPLIYTFAIHVLLLGIAVLFRLDAMFLRWEIKKYVNEKTQNN